MKFTNIYTDFYGTEISLTPDELTWFFNVVEKFHRLKEADGLEITNRNHEKDFHDKSKDALGIFYTDDPDNRNANCFITIDNYFIHECYDTVFNGFPNISGETLEHCIAHEIAHRFKFRHCKTHRRITEEIMDKYNSLS